MTFIPCVTYGAQAISIHMPHTWHDASVLVHPHMRGISIHMPHTWHDLARIDGFALAEISIHMPHTWHDSRINEN